MRRDHRLAVRGGGQASGPEVYKEMQHVDPVKGSTCLRCYVQL